MVQHDEGVAVAGRFECVDERVALLNEEPVIPRVDNVCDVTFVDDPPFLREVAGHFDGDLVIMPVWPRALPIVMQDPMARTDPNRLLFSNQQCSLPCSLEHTCPGLAF